MTKLFTEDDFIKASGEDRLPLKCEYCGSTFYARKTYIKFCSNSESHNDRLKFCSTKCCAKSFITYKILKCAWCGKEVLKTRAEIVGSKSGNVFCGHSCAAKYNNTHKTTGNRRSKLEEYIKTKIEEAYPLLDVRYNEKDAIGSELDIYIPSLKLAFELNGIYHYEPIHGEEKLKSIQENDNRKFKRCIEEKISLCTIDSSGLKYFKEKNAMKYWEIVKNIINENIKKGE